MENLGIPKGYNRGMAVSSGTHVVITGCDRIMPTDWLKTWAHYIDQIPNTATISCYTDEHPGRRREPPEVINGLTIQKAMPCEARICSKEFLLKAGFFREDFGLYGYEDSEWIDRAEVTARAHDYLHYVIPGMDLAAHLKDDDFPHTFNGMSYRDWKTKENSDPRKAILFKQLWEEGSPYYNPYYQIEKDRLKEIIV